jgi:hypothetical protein
LKGTKISVVFPTDVYKFLQDICKKMTTIPATNPMTNAPMLDPKTGKNVGMSHTGEVDELIHVSIISSLIPLIQQHPAFLEETTKLTKFMESYGTYMKTLGDRNTSQKTATTFGK